MSLQELEEQRGKDREIELQAPPNIKSVPTLYGIVNRINEIFRGLDNKFKEVHQLMGEHEQKMSQIQTKIDRVLEKLGISQTTLENALKELSTCR